MAAASAGAFLLDGPSPVRRNPARPNVVAAASGDVSGGRAIVWGQSDRTSRLVVEYATTRATDYTARVDLSGLPAGQRIFYRVRFEDPTGRVTSEPLSGRLRTAPA